MIATLLNLEGYEVSTASSGAEAMKFLEAERPGASDAETPVDLILLDVMLGDEDGRDFCREIKEDEKIEIHPRHYPYGPLESPG